MLGDREHDRAVQPVRRIARGVDATAAFSDTPEPRSRSNLPNQLTSFVGRRQELADIVSLLTGISSRVRLLTLTGVGGGGKTRLALEAASVVRDQYQDGVWLTELAPLSDSALVAKTVAMALGVAERHGQTVTETLIASLQSKHLLLVLDNCEHLIAPCAHLAEALLRACPQLQILATSREPLRVTGEQIWLVPPLSTPDSGGVTGLNELLQYESVQLFSERAKAMTPTFAATPQNASALAHLCWRLDGIPLAIELAAARTSALSVEQIDARLDGYFRLLTSGSQTAAARQQTLKATVDWSYHLLADRERCLFRQLAVFAGGFTLEAAEAVCRDNGIDELEVLDLLTRLVEKSLVLAEPDGEGAMRYRLLEPVRQYAWEHLLISQSAERIGERHADYYLALAERAESATVGPEQGDWMLRLEREHDNLRSALRWLRDHAEVERALRLASALVRFWWVRGYCNEGRAQIQSILGHPSTSARTPEWAKALRGLGELSLGRAELAVGDYDAARAAFEESLSIYRALGDPAGTAAVLRDLGRLGVEVGDYANAHLLLDESLTLERELDNRRGIALTLKTLGWLTGLQEDFPAARSFLEEAIGIFQELSDLFYIGACLTMLVRVDCEQGAHAAAHSRFALVAMKMPLHRFPWAVPLVLEVGARLATVEQRFAPALRIAGAAAGLREKLGIVAAPAYRAYVVRRVLEPTRQALDDTTAAWDEGRAMTMEQAIAYAVESTEPVPAAAPPSRAGAARGLPPLTPRELEVAVLLARGLTNRRIAAELVISESTAEVHVKRILSKLGFNSRSQVAVWAVQQGLTAMPPHTTPH